MFNRLRGLACNIAGKEADDWADSLPFDSLPPGHVYVSGDLKSATTLFSGEFAEAVIDELAGCVGLDDEEVSEILSGMTRSTFAERVDGEWKILCEQVRGQNLGATCSFPILDMISIVIGFETHGKVEDLLALKGPNFKETIKRLLLFGAQGDDFVTWGPRSISGSWIDAVMCTGGVPEPSKSPVHPSLWTVNSMMYRNRDRLPVISPAMLFNLAERLKTPSDRWVDQIESCSFLHVGRIGIAHLIFGDIPRQLGGLGELPSGGKLWTRRLRCAELSAVVTSAAWMSEEMPVGLLHQGNGTRWLSYEEEKLKLPSVRVTGLVRRDWYQEYSRRVYRLRDILFWSSSSSKVLSEKQIRRKVEKSESKVYQLSAYQDLERVSFLNYAYDHGYIILENRQVFEEVTAVTSIHGVPVAHYLH